MNHQKDMRRRRERKARSTRRRILRRGGRPRLVVTRSLKNISAQVIDDTAGRTLAAASSREGELGAPSEGKAGKCGVAATVGTAIAARSKDAGVSQVVFDRRYYKYHGRVKALADAAREGGLEF